MFRLLRITLCLVALCLFNLSIQSVLGQTQFYYYVLAKGDWVEYVVVKAVNTTIPCDTAIDSSGYKPLRNGDKIRIEIIDVCGGGGWRCIYPNDTVAWYWWNGLIFNVYLNGETVWENLSIPSFFSRVFPSSLDSHGWIFHPIEGNGYWNSFGNWSEFVYNEDKYNKQFSLTINDGVVALCYSNGDGNLRFSQISKDTGVYLEIYTVSPTAESDLRIIDSNIPNILDLPLSPNPTLPVAVILSTPTQSDWWWWLWWSKTTNTVVLRWTPSQDPNFARYEVPQIRGMVGYLPITNNASVTYTVTDLAPGRSYYFTIRVVNTEGLYTDSNWIKVKTAALPFYMETWFIAILIVVTVVVIIYAVRRRRKRLLLILLLILLLLILLLPYTRITWFGQ